MNDLTYDVKIWTTRVRNGKRGNVYEVRWAVANKARSKSHSTTKLAESFRSSLVTASRQGLAFDVASGLPEHLARQLSSVTWYEHAKAFVDMKWARASARHRRSIAEALATVTPALLDTGRGAPSPEAIRRTLYQWSFNTTARKSTPDPDTARVDAWLTENSLPLLHLSQAALTRSALDQLALKLDGKPAAHTTVARKRAVFYGALRYAVELDHLPFHPMDRVSWTTPKADDEIDQRVVINPQQAVGLLKAVEEMDPAMVGFFACMYYAALRPGEVVHLRKENCTLPETGWGKLMLGGSTQYAGAWGDNGHGREDRALKHRSSRSVRPVPACPQLVRILRHHLDNYTCGPDGRLFVTRTGKQRIPVSGGYAGPVSGSSYGNTWRKARAAALTKAEAASPLARRPYDLRHACVSLWLNAGVPATQVAEWAGHSVAVLLRVYAKCIAGQEDSAQHRVDIALNAAVNGEWRPPAADQIAPETAG